MNIKTLFLASAFSLAASFAYGAMTSDAVIADFTSQGFTSIEVKQGPTQIKVEGIRGAQKLEIIYDIATGAILKREFGPLEADDDLRPGISVRSRDRDFIKLDANGNDDDDGQEGDDDSGPSHDHDDDGDHDGDDDGHNDDGDDGHSDQGKGKDND
jgi:hypothetical protein